MKLSDLEKQKPIFKEDSLFPSFDDCGRINGKMTFGELVKQVSDKAYEDVIKRLEKEAFINPKEES